MWLPFVIETMPPAYFSVVMATGIVAMASYLELNLRWLASVLTILNAATFVVLAVLMITRAVRYPRAVYDDLKDFNRGPGFFAIVAGTVVLGSQMLVIFDRTALALAFWVFAIPIWAGFTYAIFTEFTINEHKPRFEEGMNGGWLISVVATQSIADLGARLSARYPFYHDGILFFALALWLAGGMLYLWLISLIFYRFTFFRFRPQDFIPPFWINMGAMAISTLAGTTLIAQASTSSLLQSMIPFLKGFTLFFWATATWWIPMLAILAYWQHVHKKMGRTYTFLYWDVVFPLGMYTVCSFQLSEVMHLPFLTWLPRLTLYIALIAWLATFIGMIRSWLRSRRYSATVVVAAR